MNLYTYKLEWPPKIYLVVKLCNVTGSGDGLPALEPAGTTSRAGKLTGVTLFLTSVFCRDQFP